MRIVRNAGVDRVVDRVEPALKAGHRFAVANDDPGIGAMHDNILVYRRSETFQRALLPRTEMQNARYSNPDNDPRGDWASDDYVSNKSKDERPTLWYSIKHPVTGDDVWPDEHAVWRYSYEKPMEIERDGRLYWGPGQSYKKPRLHGLQTVRSL